MTNAQINVAFLNATDAKTRESILAAIAAHYGVCADDVMEELTQHESEHLLDYLTGSMRTAISLLMKRHHLA